MILMQILCLSVSITMVYCIETNGKKLHRFVGGHIKILQNSSDNRELLDTKSSSKVITSKKTTRQEVKPNADEEKKTLSQQVADGKYGLIQKELFRKPLKKPGIVSYDPNPEIPKDTIENLGNLTMEDIWLAENHLLVLKGGNYPPHEDTNDNNSPIWPAIDNYTSPKRPIKIPINPKIPPPFPVQLTDEGPIQILGTNSSRTIDGPSPVFAVPSTGYEPGTGPFYPQYQNQADPSSGGTANQYTGKTQGEGERGPPFPSFLNGSLPPLSANLPQGAVAVPPPLINDFDEDDPSIYYPPPYSFSFPSKDNLSLVPPGPLVPGIILPPPPNLFALLEHSTTKPIKYRQKNHKTTPSPQIRPTTIPISSTPIIDISSHASMETTSENTTKGKTVEIYSPRQPSIKPLLSQHKPHTKRPSVTILKPVQHVETHKTYYNKKPEGIPFTEYGPPNTTRDTSIISSTQVPFKHSYSVPNELNVNTIITKTERSKTRPSDYYYYEEPQKNIKSTFSSNEFFNLPNQYYGTSKKVPTPNTHFIFVTSRPSNTQKPKFNTQQKTSVNSFRFHLGKLRKQIDYYTSPKPVVHSPRPVYQYSFQAANYETQRQNDFKPSQPESSLDDQEGFRPMGYSIQIQPNINVPSERPFQRSPVYFEQRFRSTTESTLEQQNFHTTPKSTYLDQRTHKKGRNLYKPQPIAQYSFETSSVNQDYKGFNLKPKNIYYDDERKIEQYTTFGQRIPAHTTPSPTDRYSTRPPKVVYITTSNNIQEKPFSLGRDTLVNYVHPNPLINSNTEFVSSRTHQRINYPQVTKYVSKPIQPFDSNFQQSFYGKPRVVDAIPIRVSDEDSERGSFFSYSLPGDNGAHFYFLTPQIAPKKDQGNGFYYSQTNAPRI